MLKLVKPGPVTRRGVVSPGSGWMNATGGNPKDLGNPYWESKSFALVTVSAWNVEDLKLYVWGTPETVQPPKSGDAFTVSTVLDLRDNPLVVRVLNPTAETKVIINMQPLNLTTI